MRQFLLFSSEQEQPAVKRLVVGEQRPGQVRLVAGMYEYDGYVIEPDGLYRPRHLVFTAEEAGIFPSCELERIVMMVDATGRDLHRQAEIRTYGKRSYAGTVWHTPVRPESIALQALDCVFAHRISLVSHCLPYVRAIFDREPDQAEAWIQGLSDAFRSRRTDPDRFWHLLRSRDIPLSSALFV